MMATDKDHLLNLITPERTLRSGNPVLLDPKELKEWISALPMANIGETSKQIFKALVEFNRLSATGLDRASTIDLFRQPIDYITANLKKYYIDLPFPLSAKNQKIAVLCRELQVELANGFKIIINNMLAGNKKSVDNKLLVIAIHQAMLYLSRALYYSAIVYNAPPNNIWREIYQLFRYADRYHLTNIKVKETSGDTNNTSTIEDVYKRTILVGMASPYSLRQREIEYLHERVTQWAPHLELETVSSHQETATIFVVEPNSDRPPCHAYLHPGTAERRYQTINTERLISHLRKQLKSLVDATKQSATDPTKERLSKPLLRKLIQSLGSTPNRQFTRTTLNFELDTAIGLSSICALMTEHAKKPKAEVSQTTGTRTHSLVYPRVGEEVRLSVTPPDQPFEYALVNMDENAGIWLQDEIKPPVTTEPQNKNGSIFSCKTFNESAGGYCLTWTGEKVPHIRVGELIGIQSSNNPTKFSIGVTRWMKSMPAIGLQIGIEMISLYTKTAQVRHMQSPAGTDQNTDALILPEQTVSEQPKSLIVHALPYRVNDAVWIERKDAKKKARLTRLLESTGAFSRFQYTYL